MIMGSSSGYVGMLVVYPVLVWCSESREAFPFLVNAAFAINRIVTLAGVTRNMLY